MPVLTPGAQIHSFVLEKQVGVGKITTVWKAVHSISKVEVAIKAIRKDSINSQVSRTRLQREISVLKKIEHPFIADFFQVGEDQDHFFIFMEYVGHNNLLDHVNENGNLTEDQARRYFCQLVWALEYLHNEKHVVHRDLKCENILLDRHDNIRLVDFGLSNMFSDVAPQLNTACGSPAYAAPEMVLGKSYTKSADIWSLGVLLYAIVVGNLPFDEENVQRLLQKIVYSEISFPGCLTPQLIDLLQKMLCKEPTSRISLEGIKQHPWFSNSEFRIMVHESQLPGSSLDEGADNNDVAIDPNIIAKMVGMRIDCRQLHQSLLTGEFSDAVAVYRMLRRDKLTEYNSTLMRRIGTSMKTVPIRQMSRLKVHSASPAPGPHATGSGGEAGGIVPLPRVLPLRSGSKLTCVSPQLPGVVDSRRLTLPVGGAVNGARRMSRPVVLRTPAMAAAGSGSLEMP
jgi:serine/threonine protein kinase